MPLIPRSSKSKKSRHDWKALAGKPYGAVEFAFIGLIKSKARRWVGKLGGSGRIYTLDDFIQEGRITAANLWTTYDPQQGGFASYLGVALDNNYKCMLDFELAMRRTPRVEALNPETGEVEHRPCRPLSLDQPVGEDGALIGDLVPSRDMRPDEILEYRDGVGDLVAMFSMIKAKLTPRQRRVFNCLYLRCPEFHDYVAGEGKSPANASKKDVARYLGLSYSQVEGDSNKIRAALRARRMEVRLGATVAG